MAPTSASPTPDHPHACDARCSKAPVRLIATATIGFDHIGLAWCAARGIHVATAAGCNARGVLQWDRRRAHPSSRTQGWKPADRTLGVVGVGHIGSLVRQYAEAWGFRVLAYTTRRARSANTAASCRSGRWPAKPTCHLPHAADASDPPMADAALFRKMKPGATVINSRGEVKTAKFPSRQSGLQWVLDVWGARAADRAPACSTGRCSRNAPSPDTPQCASTPRCHDGGDAEPPFLTCRSRVASAAGRPCTPRPISGGELCARSAKPMTSKPKAAF